ncbi:MAG TPA: hypothetical protein V6D25_17180 [Leptolyngbyaceae cyanobacterium]
MFSLKADTIINIIVSILISAFGVLVFENAQIALSYKIIFFILLGLCVFLLYKRELIIEKYKIYRNFDKIDNLKLQIKKQTEEIFKYYNILENTTQEFKKTIESLEGYVNILFQQVSDDFNEKQSILEQIENLQKTIKELEKFEDFFKEINKDLSDAEKIKILLEPRTQDVINYVNQMREQEQE